MYGEILPSLLKLMFHPEEAKDEAAFNTALSKVWLYSSREVALKVDTAVSYKLYPERGDFLEAMKSAIAEMRRDIQPWWRRSKRKLADEEIKHFYLSLKKVKSS